MVRWLEANGFDVSYFTGMDSDRRGNLIRNHRVFFSVGHDEYWSGGQRANVEAARDANPGVNLAFFSGNEVFWKTRWENNILPGTPTPTNPDTTYNGPTTYRTLVCYKETQSNSKIDPLPGVWTGTWMDPRFGPHDGGRPQNALTGTLYRVNRDGTDTMEIPAEDGKMRFWRNIPSITQLPPGAIATLPNGVLGYEWDEDPDNGLRPAGQIRLSQTVASGQAYLRDYGSTYTSGTATHNMTLHRSGTALVFSAGTIQGVLGVIRFLTPSVLYLSGPQSWQERFEPLLGATNSPPSQSPLSAELPPLPLARHCRAVHKSPSPEPPRTVEVE